MEAVSTDKKVFQRTKFTLEEQQPLMNILTEYEDVNKGLTALVELYEKEHVSLRSESIKVVQENQRLADELNANLKSASENSDKDALTNLRQQLNLTLQEKEAALELWKLAVGEVSNLEKVLKIFQEQRDSGYSSIHGANARLEKARALNNAECQLVETRAQLARERILRSELESHLAREKESRLNVAQQLEAASLQLQHAHEEERKRLEMEKQEVQQMQALVRARDDLQRALDQSQTRLQQAVTQAEEGRQRVAEALALVDTACMSRDQAMTSEAKSKEEALKLQEALQELTKEASARVKREVEQVKLQCNARIQTLLVDMKKLQEENAEQKTLAERGMKGQKQAEEALEQRAQDLRAASARQVPLETHVQTMHAQLAETERRAIRAENALETLQEEVEGEKNRWRHEEGNAESTRRMLELRVNSLAQELEETRHKSANMAQEMSVRERQLAARLEAVEKNSTTTVSELHQIVNAHQNISEKCQAEMRAMAERFSDRLKELRSEVVRLRRERDDAHRELHMFRVQTPSRSTSKLTAGECSKGRPRSLFLDC